METVVMIEFNGMDIIVRSRIDDERVRRALSTVLHVPAERVVLISDVSHYPPRGDADVVCISSQAEGEFTSALSIQCDCLALPYKTHAQLMQVLGERLEAQYITPDDDMDPYVMWLTSPGAVPGKVDLDPVAFDEGRYVIARKL